MYYLVLQYIFDKEHPIVPDSVLLMLNVSFIKNDLGTFCTGHRKPMLFHPVKIVPYTGYVFISKSFLYRMCTVFIWRIVICRCREVESSQCNRNEKQTCAQCCTPVCEQKPTASASDWGTDFVQPKSRNVTPSAQGSTKTQAAPAPVWTYCIELSQRGIHAYSFG